MYFNSRPGRAIALLLVAFLLTACGGGASTPTNAAPVASRVTISGTVVLGSLLTGNFTYADAESDAQGSSTLRWMRSGNSGGTDKVAISGAITRNYTVVAADLGSYLYFCVLPVAISGTSPGIEVCSLATIAVPASANTMIVTVDAGPDNSGYNVNRLYTSVTICYPGSGTLCQTIHHILVDTKSTGLRLLSNSGLSALSLPRMTTSPANLPLLSCVRFVDGTFAWGPVASADLVLGGKSAVSVPIQIIGDPAYAKLATACSAFGTAMTTATDLGANGIIGLDLFKDDCGSRCATTRQNGIYFTCTDASCVSTKGTTAAVGQQLKNPVPLFAQDNNGILIDLPTITTATAAALSGTLTFGIHTQSNNQFTPGTLLTTDTLGNFTTSLAGQSYTTSFLDTGSNGLFFDSTAIRACIDSSVGFYCPVAQTPLTATLVGVNLVSASVTFAVDNATSLFADSSQHALPNLAGPISPLGNAPDPFSFDWGLPFFYGRRVFIGIEGQQSTLGTGPFYAF